ncbi:amidase family protein [Celeribacter litoreus]|uniref:amidase family protein n=1 Tax=Celeribacter litoreus TaxID=2876714 RepID=UPI001CCF864E|nr:amidase [Celeribacter litoreus]MCA0042535.1 amidase [Celeribacter litoreus]
MSAIEKLHGHEIAEAVQSGKISARDIAANAAMRIAKFDPLIGAYSQVSSELAMSQAEDVDNQRDKGLLAGITVGLSESIATKHSVRRAPVSGLDATCVSALRTHGAILVGQTVSAGLTPSSPPAKTRNPHDFSRTAGGSSGGAAAAVASGLCALGLGTQTAGETSLSASYCGVWGWKPTWSLISQDGFRQASPTCDTVGFFARSGVDFSLLADALHVPDDQQPTPKCLKGLRIGLCRGPDWENIKPAMIDAYESAAKSLRLEGADVIEVRLPSLFDGLPEAHRKITAKEGLATFLGEMLTNAPEQDPALRDTIDSAKRLSPTEMRNAYTLSDICRSEFEDIISGVDAILTPSACDEAPEAGVDQGEAAMDAISTLLHVPVLSVPGLTGPHGLPLGMSIITPRYSDRRAIAIACLVGDLFALENTMA